MNAFELVNITLPEAEAVARAAEQQGHHTLIGALVLRPDGHLFAQRRSPTRHFGPGWWDNVGGHLEAGETLHQALEREVTEETGWQLSEITRIIALRTWSDPRGISREFVCVCTVTGDLDNPVLETDKIDQTAWINAGNLTLINQNRLQDTSQAEIYAHALKVIHETSPSR